MKKHLLICTAISLVLGAGAHAAAADQAGAASANQGGLDEVVVTAERHTETLQKAPIALSAVTGADLRDLDVSKPTELTELVPALQISQGGGPYSLFYLRGVGNFNGNPLSDAAIAFNFAGVYIGRPSSTAGSFYDLDRVEVLKGPQGTLYGRNATGGAINVLPHMPDLNQTYADVSVEGGNYATFRTDADANLALGAKAAIRLAGFHAQHEGYLKDGTDDEDDSGGRLSARLEVTDDLEVTGVFDYYHQGGEGGGAVPVALGISNRYGLLSPEGQAYYRTQFVGQALDTVAPISITPFERNDYWGLSTTVEWTTGLGKFTLVPAYRQGHLDFDSVNAGFVIRQKENDDQTSVELRYNSPDELPVKLLAGLFYYNENNDVPLVFYNNQFNFLQQSFNTSTDSKAAFSRITYDVTEDFHLNAGARYTAEDKTFAGNLVGGNQFCSGLLNRTFTPCFGATPFPYDNFSPVGSFTPTGGTIFVPNFLTENTSKSFYRATWRVGADWNVTDRNMIYASYETGFKAGGFFFTADNPVFRPESIAAWTVGAKNRFLDNKLELNGEAFYWSYKNQQISHLGEDSAGDVIFPTQNVGASTYRGFELDAKARVLPTTTLSTDIQYLDARYDSFAYNVPNLGAQPLTGCEIAGPPTSVYKLNCSGMQPPFAPKWTVNLGLQQFISLGDSGDLTADFRTHFQSGSLTALDFIPAEYQGAYWMSDATLTYNPPDERFWASLYVDNIENAAVAGQTFPAPINNIVTATLRPPRTFGVRLGAHF